MNFHGLLGVINMINGGLLGHVKNEITHLLHWF